MEQLRFEASLVADCDVNWACKQTQREKEREGERCRHSGREDTRAKERDSN